jgi:hypothetical protein
MDSTKTLFGFAALSFVKQTLLLLFGGFGSQLPKPLCLAHQVVFA